MQKSKKIVILIFIIIIVLGIVLAIINLNKDKTDRVLNMYNSIQNSQRYTFTIQEVNSDIQYKISIMHRGTDTNLDMESENEHTSTLILEDHVYYIWHDEQEYYVYDSNNADGDVILEGLKDIDGKEYTHGVETLYGTEYYYEEYENITSFAILVDVDEDATIKTRFYFDGDDIVYIKNIVTDEDIEKEELLKITLEYDVDDSAFEIPADYAEL